MRKPNTRKIFLFILLYLIWCALTWVPGAKDLISGAIVSLIISLVFGDMLYVDYFIFLRPKNFLYLIYFIPVLLCRSVRANLEVAYHVLSPKLNIKPGIVKIKTSLKTDAAKAILANTLTLIPGTLTVDMIDDHLYVHWLDVKAEDVRGATDAISGDLERIIKEAFE